MGVNVRTFNVYAEPLARRKAETTEVHYRSVLIYSMCRMMVCVRVFGLLLRKSIIRLLQWFMGLRNVCTTRAAGSMKPHNKAKKGGRATYCSMYTFGAEVARTVSNIRVSSYIDPNPFIISRI